MASRTRDADRSRALILDAAERLFAERGFERVTLADIGAAASLSRGTPAYFYGSKDELYAAVLARVFAARTEALEPAFAPLRDWDGEGPLEDALAIAVDGYVAFLRERPSFVALVQREGLAGGERLAATPHDSPVMRDALTALRGREATKPFSVDDVLVAFVALCFFPLSASATMLRDREPADAAYRERVVEAITELVV